MGELSGTVVLITGAGRGLGKASTLAMLGAGAQVVLTSRDKASLDETIAESGAGDRAVAIVADISRAEECERLADEARAAFGRIDVLFNNAGLGPTAIRDDPIRNPIRFWEIDRATLELHFAVNHHAPFTLATALVPDMVKRGWGRIVNVSTSLDTMFLFVPYGGTKAALEAHTARMASDLEGTGVTANVLLPGGVVATRMTEDLHMDLDQMIGPEIMAAPSVWLASRASDGVTAMRFIAHRWDPKLPADEAMQHAGFPVAWKGYGPKAIYDARIANATN